MERVGLLRMILVSFARASRTRVYTQYEEMPFKLVFS